MTTATQSTTTSIENWYEDHPYGTVKIVNHRSAFFGETLTLKQFFPPAGYREGNRSAWVIHPDYGTLSFSESDVELLEIHYYPINPEIDDNPDRLKGEN